ncbi:AAA family ATPase [Streptomyces gibsoniae]|uniref:ArsR family transcriptional regulator n=1 Tax=Streptomyces gibsoniae TaxID=3075529 RepID=A0ABU2U6M2_9ACTN|nr:ArsR family transcriptional regulator [Streptomyces sp. DSM 41699]MDT0468627.1 ArsR family transcriptional regulator [Streptomyces sp. DSM 41699]
MAPSDLTHPAKPETLFDRDAEWDALVAFSSATRTGASLGVVSGRLRQGKTYLLKALTAALGGFYFGAQPATQAESLRRLRDELTKHTGASPPNHWRGWEDAVDALLALGDARPVPIVVDEFPDLVRQSPELPSVIHSAYRRLRESGRNNRARLLLSGSALPVMHRLFCSASPLHELADLELTLRPLDFRQAARFWGIDDPGLALLVHAVVGGTLAYQQYSGDHAPSGPDDFDAWMCRAVLNPRTPLFLEAHHLLQEETDHWDRALCHSVLAAVASGCSTQGEIAECLDTTLTEASHCLALLQANALLHGEPDAFRPNLVRLHITEPLLAFEHAAIWAHRSALEQKEAVEVWRHIRPVFDSAVACPHFTQVCRDWVMDFADPAIFGARPATAAHGSLPGPVHRADLEADVVVRGPVGASSGALLSVGMARWDEVMDVPHLEHLRRLLAMLGEDVAHTRLACYSGVGFAPKLRSAEADGDVVLVGLDRLYGVDSPPGRR